MHMYKSQETYFHTYTHDAYTYMYRELHYNQIRELPANLFKGLTAMSRLWERLYACMHACMHVHACMCLWIPGIIAMSGLWELLYACMHASVSEYVSDYPCVQSILVWLYTCIIIVCPSTCVPICIHACAYTRMRLCMPYTSMKHICICTCAHQLAFPNLLILRNARASLYCDALRRHPPVQLLHIHVYIYTYVHTYGQMQHECKSDSNPYIANRQNQKVSVWQAQ
jgi:hypothetical protein